MKKIFFGISLLSTFGIWAAPAWSLPLEIKLQTGGDDLRGGSYANFYVKLREQPLIPFVNITGSRELSNNSDLDFFLDVPQLTSPEQIEYFEIEHISQEGFGQTADNWDLENAQVITRFGSFPIILGESG